MDLAEMQKRGEIAKVGPDMKMANRLLLSSEEWISAAEDSRKAGHAEASLALAYNAMLNAGRALLAAKGFRTASESHHKTVVAFCAAVIPKEASALVS